MPKISIIVPVYKAENYIEQCVKSILQQSFSDFELLLIDDGSPDQSGQICERLAETDSRIRVIHKPNGGASSARNCGLDKASGEFIMFCDSDDRPHEDWCASLLAAMSEGGADICVCGYAVVNNGQIVRKIMISSDNGKYVDTDLWTLFDVRLLNTPWNKIFRHSIIEKEGLRFDEHLTDGEDQCFNLRYLQLSSQRIRILPKALYYFTEDNAESVTSRYIPNMWEQKKASYRLLQQMLLKDGETDISRVTKFYGSYMDAISRVLVNNMSSGNKVSTFRKIQMNSRILRDPVCKTALKQGECKTLSKRYVRLLKIPTYLPVYLAGKLCR